MLTIAKTSFNLRFKLYYPPCCVPTMNLLGMVHSYSRMLAPCACAVLVSSPAPGSSTSLSTLPVNLLVSHHSTWTVDTRASNESYPKVTEDFTIMEKHPTMAFS